MKAKQKTSTTDSTLIASALCKLGDKKTIEEFVNHLKDDPIKCIDELKKKSEETGYKSADEILKEIESNNTIVRNLNSEKSISEDLKRMKPKTDKIYSEKDLKEKVENISFINDVMTKFNFYVNEEAKSFIAQTSKYEEIEVEDPNIFIKISPNNERDRLLFKDKLISSGEKRRPIYINIGDCDLFFEYFDKDELPIFSYNRENLIFFFSNDINKFKEYIENNKCSFGLGINLGLHRINDKSIKFDDMMVEIIDKKKKKEKINEKVSTPDKLKEELKKEPKEDPKEEISEEPKEVNKKVCKVKFLNNDQLFILTKDPGDIFKEFNNEVLSVKIIGDGILI